MSRAPVALITTSLPTLHAFGDARLGRLFTPKMIGNVDGTVETGTLWAADNGAFGGFDAQAWLDMLGKITRPGGQDGPRAGELFVVAPDVVADARATRELFETWAPEIAAAGHPAAYVLQDGETGTTVPWADIAAVFIGGSTEYKLSPEAARIVRHARDLGLLAHMGRVNTRRRYLYAAAIGCTSVDGSSFGRFPRLKVPALQGWMDEIDGGLDLQEVQPA